MANNAHTVRITFTGTISQVQTFSTGCWFRYYGGGVAIPSAAEMLDAITNSSDFQGYVDSLWAVLSGYMSQSTIMQNWNAAVYGEDPTKPVEGLAGTLTAFGGSSGHNLPPECALVASLRTDLKGRSGRGRMYLPLTGMLIGNDGLAPAVCATDVAGAVAAFLNSCDGHTFESSTGSDTGRLRAVVNSTTHGMTSDVNKVLVDTRVDAQRRREDKLPSVTHQASVS